MNKYNTTFTEKLLMKALRAEPSPIGQIFSRHEFIIPDFQRPYSWGIEQCEQLWIDIINFIDELLDGKRDDKEQYFLGSIVVHPDEEDKNSWVIIDGQQRLTTLLILIRLLFKCNSTYIILQKMFYKTDPKTTNIITEPRLRSKVLSGDGRNDYKDFQQIMRLETTGLDDKNPFKLNHNVLSEKLNKWWDSKKVKQREDALKWFQENIVLLPIECDSLDDALTLFQIINDRGMNLNDADIFKANMYEMPEQRDRDGFIKRWNAIVEHETLFRIHMHVLRSKQGYTGKEIGLRSYIQEYFKSLTNRRTDWDSILCSLENYHQIRTQESTCSGEFAHDEKIFWAILNQYPNIYWWYPLYVFLDKYGKQKKGVFSVVENKQEEYISLLKNTVRYFFIKGVVHNAVNFVKDTTFKICAAIAKEENYIEVYRQNIKPNELYDFRRKLSENDYGQRYRKGLIWLCASLNDNQNRADYADIIGNCQVEHILPWKWANYDRWTDALHEENIDKIGNCTPLEWKRNIQASAEFFQRKQDKYKGSKIQDALDLSKKTPSHWYPEDVEERQECSLGRLRKFFIALNKAGRKNPPP